MAAKLIPEIIVSDIERSLDFYTVLLGFSILYRRPEDGFAYLEREGPELMLEQSKDQRLLAGELEYPYGRGLSLQIEVTNIATLHRLIQMAGVSVFMPLEDKWYRCDEMLLGSWQLVIQDPDGYLLRFFEDLGVKPA